MPHPSNPSSVSRRYERETRESFIRGHLVTVSCHTVTTGVAGTRRPTGQVRARHPVDTGLDPPGEVAGISAPDSRPEFDDGRPDVFIYHGGRAPAWSCQA